MLVKEILMKKKGLIFFIALLLSIYFIGVKEISRERSKKRGLMEVYNVLYENKLTRKEILESAVKLRGMGNFSEARRMIEENIIKAHDDMWIERFLDDLENLSKRSLNINTIRSCIKDNEIGQYYQKVTEDNIKNLNIESDTSRLIFVDIQEQRTYIFKDNNNNNNRWILENKFICATGQENTPTPVGVFKIGIRGEWFYNSKFDKGAKYYMVFDGSDYLFHSVPYYKDKKTVFENRLGVPMSHGCIRHSTENQKWLYDNVEEGTKVIIY